MLAARPDTGTVRLQARWLDDGALQRLVTVLPQGWTGQDVAVIHDRNGDGLANDPAWAVLGRDPLGGAIAVESRRLLDGALLKSITFLGSSWRSQRLLSSADMGGNGFEELGVLAARATYGRAVIQLRDYDQPATFFNILP